MISDNFNKLKQILDPSTTSFERKRQSKNDLHLDLNDTAALYSDQRAASTASALINITHGFKESPSNHAIRKATEKFDAEAICLEQFPPKEN